MGRGDYHSTSGESRFGKCAWPERIGCEVIGVQQTGRKVVMAIGRVQRCLHAWVYEVKYIEAILTTC